MSEIILYAGTVAVLIAAATVDVRKGKIPNILLLILICIQVAAESISIFLDGSPIYSGTDLAVKILQSILVILFFYPFYIFGGLGAGDIKLLAVTVLSVSDVPKFILSVFIIGAVAGLSKELVMKVFKNRIGKGERVIVHLAVPVLLAFLLAVYMGA